MHLVNTLSLFALLGLLSYPVVDACSGESSDIGNRIYQKGIGADGKPVKAHGIGGTLLTASQAACATCHRRSGYGSSEGGMLAPPVIGNLLFTERDFHYKELKRNMSRPITRPPYTKKLLARALHEGIAANGQALKSLMPRYSLSKAEIKHLVAYLKSMGRNGSIGVDKENVYIASVVTPGVPDRLKESMLATLQTYVNNKNAETRDEDVRSKKSPWYRSWKYTAYRRWQLKIWELHGDPSTWNAQLESYYKQQPVFAMVSGIGTTTWQPVHRFCETRRLPCLFPTVTEPGRFGENYYSIYFSAGIKVQAETILKHIKGNMGSGHRYRIVQVVSEDQGQEDRASIFEQAFLASSLHEMVTIKTIKLKDIGELKRSKGINDILVAWMPIPHLGQLNDIRGAHVDRIYVASADPYNISSTAKLETDLYFVHPYTLPKNLDRALLRQTSWARIHHLASFDKEVSANTYYAVTVFNRALKHLRSNFSRDYLIERIEHMLDNNVFNSVYPHLSLGPSQRFASKGCYVVGPFREPARLNTADSGQWIVSE